MCVISFNAPKRERETGRERQPKGRHALTRPSHGGYCSIGPARIGSVIKSPEGRADPYSHIVLMPDPSNAPLATFQEQVVAETEMQSLTFRRGTSLGGQRPLTSLRGNRPMMPLPDSATHPMSPYSNIQPLPSPYDCRRDIDSNSRPLSPMGIPRPILDTDSSPSKTAESPESSPDRSVKSMNTSALSHQSGQSTESLESLALSVASYMEPTPIHAAVYSHAQEVRELAASAHINSANSVKRFATQAHTELHWRNHHGRQSARIKRLSAKWSLAADQDGVAIMAVPVASTADNSNDSNSNPDENSVLMSKLAKLGKEKEEREWCMEYPIAGDGATPKEGSGLLGQLRAELRCRREAREAHSEAARVQILQHNAEKKKAQKSRLVAHISDNQDKVLACEAKEDAEQHRVNEAYDAALQAKSARAAAESAAQCDKEDARNMDGVQDLFNRSINLLGDPILSPGNNSSGWETTDDES